MHDLVRAPSAQPLWRWLWPLLGTLLLGCSGPVPALGPDAQPAAIVTVDEMPARWQRMGAPAIVLLGEQHDDPSHPPLQQALLQAMVQHGGLGALVLEMAEQGHSTAGLPPTATEAAVQAALAWSTPAWPWERYRPVIMSAVAAGVPVLGGNLPRSAMRAAMADPSWDRLLPADALNDLRERLRQGHCDLLPASQIAPMARIQLARDQAMARTVMSAWQPGRSVLLLAGNEHVRNDMAVPWHLRQWAPPWPATTVVASIQLRPDAPGPDTVSANETGQVWRTPMATGRDHCQDLRRQLRQSGS